MTFIDLWSEIIYLIRKNGIWGNLKLIAIRIFRSGFPYYAPTIVLFKMDLEDRNRSREHGDLIIRDGNLYDWLSMVGTQTEYRRRKYTQSATGRFNNCEKLYVVEINGHLVHYSWVAKVDEIILPELHTRVKLARKGWYMYNSFTVREARRKGIYTSVLIHVAYELGDAGEKELYGYVISDNMAALTGIGKTGAWPYRIDKMTKILGIVVSRRSQTLPKPLSE